MRGRLYDAVDLDRVRVYSRRQRETVPHRRGLWRIALIDGQGPWIRKVTLFLTPSFIGIWLSASERGHSFTTTEAREIDRGVKEKLCFIADWLHIGPTRSRSTCSETNITSLSVPNVSVAAWRTCDLLTTWCCSQHPKDILKTWCVNSKKQQRKWDSRFTLTGRKFSAMKAAWILTQKRYVKIGDMNIEMLAKSESVKHMGQRISFYQQETLEIESRIRAAWTTFRKYRQELTSKKYMLKLRLRLFDATVSPTLCYAAGTWTPSREHERMIQSTQRKMVRLIIQTKRKYKKKQVIEHSWGRKWRQNRKSEHWWRKRRWLQHKSEDDMYSGVTFDEDSDKDIDTVEIEEEDCIDYIRRSTADAIDKMEHRCWNKTHRKMKWKLALRIATSPSERWIKKAAEWNPELSSSYRTNRAIGRPKKKDGNNTTSMISSDKIVARERLENRLKEGIKTVMRGSILPLTGKWTRLEEKYTMKSVKWQKELCNVVLEQSSSSTAIKNIVKATAAAVQQLRAGERERKRSRSTWRVLNWKKSGVRLLIARKNKILD